MVRNVAAGGGEVEKATVSITLLLKNGLSGQPHLERLKEMVERLNVLSGPKSEACPVEPQ